MKKKPILFNYFKILKADAKHDNDYMGIIQVTSETEEDITIHIMKNDSQNPLKLDSRSDSHIEVWSEYKRPVFYRSLHLRNFSSSSRIRMCTLKFLQKELNAEMIANTFYSSLKRLIDKNK